MTCSSDGGSMISVTGFGGVGLPSTGCDNHSICGDSSVHNRRLSGGRAGGDGVRGPVATPHLRVSDDDPRGNSRHDRARQHAVLGYTQHPWPVSRDVYWWRRDGIDLPASVQHDADELCIYPSETSSPHWTSSPPDRAPARHENPSGSPRSSTGKRKQLAVLQQYPGRIAGDGGKICAMMFGSDAPPRATTRGLRFTRRGSENVQETTARTVRLPLRANGIRAEIRQRRCDAPTSSFGASHRPQTSGNRPTPRKRLRRNHFGGRGTRPNWALCGGRMGRPKRFGVRSEAENFGRSTFAATPAPCQ